LNQPSLNYQLSRSLQIVSTESVFHQMQAGEASELQSRPYPRAILSEEQVVEIYQYQWTKPNRFNYDPLLTGRASAVAIKYNVSPKAIRDIWNRRTWKAETRHLWLADETPRDRGNQKSIFKAMKPSGPNAGSKVYHQQSCSCPDPRLSIWPLTCFAHAPNDQGSSTLGRMSTVFPVTTSADAETKRPLPAASCSYIHVATTTNLANPPQREPDVIVQEREASTPFATPPGASEDQLNADQLIGPAMSIPDPEWLGAGDAAWDDPFGLDWPCW
jgi:hypothetical protein